MSTRHVQGRHALANHPLKRESIPYCVVMPKEKIALFTYTWVNKESVAGADAERDMSGRAARVS
jgi:hypothetical protein